MAKVLVGQVGSTVKEVEADTVREALEAAGFEKDTAYTVQINGQSASMDEDLDTDGVFLSVGQKVKGGM